jgi:hypothetical protein
LNGNKGKQGNPQKLHLVNPHQNPFQTEPELKSMKTQTNPVELTKALNALARYDRRQARIERPEGKSDNGGRWYAHGRDADALANVREPSRSWPLSQLKACASLAHCERYEDADHATVLAVRRALKAKGLSANDPAAREAFGLPALEGETGEQQGRTWAALKARAERLVAWEQAYHAPLAVLV